MWEKTFKMFHLFMGLPWLSSGEDSALPMQGAQVRSLVGELDPTFMLQLKIPHATTKDPTCHNKDPECGN